LEFVHTERRNQKVYRRTDERRVSVYSLPQAAVLETPLTARETPAHRERGLTVLGKLLDMALFDHVNVKHRRSVL
jgi:hypothetical protein